MAKIVPSIEKAKASKQPPTEGEIFLLEYLRDHFDPEAEVYFQPCFNGDRPDIVIIKKGLGVIVIEVKDWNLDLYEIDSKNRWILKKNGAILKSPFEQAFAYKKNIFEIHINGLLEKNLKNKSFYNLINTYVYFHNASVSDIKNLYSTKTSELNSEIKINANAFTETLISHEKYSKKDNYLKNKKRQFERDASKISTSRETLHKIVFPNKSENILFDESVYHEFIRLLNPPFHYMNEGLPLTYTKKQARLCESIVEARAKICGVAGSGKTTVLAKRAVNAHKRHGGSVLILTYNLTLRMYIKDRISQVREDFSWAFFDIINYHKFMTIALNNAEIKIAIPEHETNKDDYMEKHYYSNLDLLRGRPIKNKYQTILIDEIQDYAPEWIKIIREYFLETDGEMVLFGDEKQNIYHKPLDKERRSTLVEGFGSWESLKKSQRYKKDSHILSLAQAFQVAFLSESYNIDSDESYQPTLSMIGINAYSYYSKVQLETVTTKITKIAKNEKIHPNDITILASKTEIAQELDFMVRTGSDHRERTITTFESKEVVNHPIYSKDKLKIRASKKFGFNLNSGVMKISTPHSFKGYESPTIFFIIGKGDSPEIVYTALTRAKENIIVFFEKDSDYAAFFEKNLEPIERFLN